MATQMYTRMHRADGKKVRKKDTNASSILVLARGRPDI